MRASERAEIRKRARAHRAVLHPIQIVAHEMAAALLFPSTWQSHLKLVCHFLVTDSKIVFSFLFIFLSRSLFLSLSLPHSSPHRLAANVAVAAAQFGAALAFAVAVLDRRRAVCIVSLFIIISVLIFLVVLVVLVVRVLRVCVL